MSVIIRLQGLSWSASAMDIRNFFTGLNIPPGGVRIIGGENGDAFIAFSTDEDARRAMMMPKKTLNDCPVQLFLSSKSEMQNTIQQAKTTPTPATTAPAIETPAVYSMPLEQQQVQVPPTSQTYASTNQPSTGLAPALASLTQLQGLLPSNITQALGFLAKANLNNQSTPQTSQQPEKTGVYESALPGEYSVGGTSTKPSIHQEQFGLNDQRNINNSNAINQNYPQQYPVQRNDLYQNQGQFKPPNTSSRNEQSWGQSGQQSHQQRFDGQTNFNELPYGNRQHTVPPPANALTGQSQNIPLNKPLEFPPFENQRPTAPTDYGFHGPSKPQDAMPPHSVDNPHSMTYGSQGLPKPLDTRVPFGADRSRAGGFGTDRPPPDITQPVGFGADRPPLGDFGADRHQSGGFGADRPPPGGFGLDKPPPVGFSADRPPPGSFGANRPSPGGFGADRPQPGDFGADRHPPGGFGADRPALGGFGADRPALGGFGVDRPPSGGFGQDRNQSVGFGADKAKSGVFGVDRDQSGGYGTDRVQPMVFGADRPPPGGFGADRPPSGGFGQDRTQSVGFGADKAKSGVFGADRAQTGGLGPDRVQPVGFGADRAKSGGFIPDRAQSRGYGPDMGQSGGFGADRAQSGGFGAERPQIGGFGVDRTHSAVSAHPGEFGENRAQPVTFGSDRSQSAGFDANRAQPRGFAAQGPPKIVDNRAPFGVDKTQSTGYAYQGGQSKPVDVKANFGVDKPPYDNHAEPDRSPYGHRGQQRHEERSGFDNSPFGQKLPPKPGDRQGTDRSSYNQGTQLPRENSRTLSTGIRESKQIDNQRQRVPPPVVTSGIKGSQSSTALSEEKDEFGRNKRVDSKSDSDKPDRSKIRDSDRRESRERERSRRDSPRDRDRRDRDRDSRRRDKDREDDRKSRRDRDRDRDRDRKRDRDNDKRDRSKDIDRKNSPTNDTGRRSKKRSLSPSSKDDKDKEKKLQTERPAMSPAGNKTTGSTNSILPPSSSTIVTAASSIKVAPTDKSGAGPQPLFPVIPPTDTKKGLLGDPPAHLQSGLLSQGPGPIMTAIPFQSPGTLPIHPNLPNLGNQQLPNMANLISTQVPPPFDRNVPPPLDDKPRFLAPQENRGSEGNRSLRDSARASRFSDLDNRDLPGELHPPLLNEPHLQDRNDRNFVPTQDRPPFPPRDNFGPPHRMDVPPPFDRRNSPNDGPHRFEDRGPRDLPSGFGGPRRPVLLETPDINRLPMPFNRDQGPPPLNDRLPPPDITVPPPVGRDGLRPDDRRPPPAVGRDGPRPDDRRPPPPVVRDGPRLDDRRPPPLVGRDGPRPDDRRPDFRGQLDREGPLSGPPGRMDGGRLDDRQDLMGRPDRDLTRDGPSGIHGPSPFNDRNPNFRGPPFSDRPGDNRNYMGPMHDRDGRPLVDRRPGNYGGPLEDRPPFDDRFRRDLASRNDFRDLPPSDYRDGPASDDRRNQDFDSQNAPRADINRPFMENMGRGGDFNRPPLDRPNLDRHSDGSFRERNFDGPNRRIFVDDQHRERNLNALDRDRPPHDRNFDDHNRERNFPGPNRERQPFDGPDRNRNIDDQHWNRNVDGPNREYRRESSGDPRLRDDRGPNNRPDHRRNEGPDSRSRSDDRRDDRDRDGRGYDSRDRSRRDDRSSQSDSRSGNPSNNSNDSTSPSGTGGRERKSDKDTHILALCSVVLESMHKETNYKDIRRFFSDCDILKDGIKIINDQEGKRVGKAYVRFASQDAYKRAMTKNRQRIRGIPSVIKPVSGKEYDEAIDSYSPEIEVMDEASRTREIDRCNTLSAALRALKGEPELEPPKKTDKRDYVLKMSMLPSQTTVEGIKKFFAGCEITKNGEAVFIESDLKHRCTGVCYVEFAHESAFKKAMSQKKVFDRTTIALTHANKKDIEHLVNKMKRELDTVGKSNQRSEPSNVTKQTSANNPSVSNKQTDQNKASSVSNNRPTSDYGKTNENNEVKQNETKQSASAKTHSENKPVVTENKSEVTDNKTTQDINNTNVTTETKLATNLTCLHLKNIPHSFRNFDVRCLFDGLGVHINNVQIPHDAIGNVVGEAFVDLGDSPSVQNVLAKKNNLVVQNQKILMTPVTKADMITQLRSYKQSLNVEPPSKQDVFYFVKASNLPQNVTTGELMTFFTGYQPAPESMRLNITDGNQPPETSTALIGFRIREDAERAVSTINMRPMRNRPVHLTKVIL